GASAERAGFQLTQRAKTCSNASRSGHVSYEAVQSAGTLGSCTSLGSLSQVRSPKVPSRAPTIASRQSRNAPTVSSGHAGRNWSSGAAQSSSSIGTSHFEHSATISEQENASFASRMPDAVQSPWLTAV